jgi:deoxyribodipyrimidine photo-lyase
MTAIVWFRRDLRIHDNAALAAALEEHATVVPVFCLDARLLEGKHRSAARAAFLHGCLVELHRDLPARGSALGVLSGRPETEIPRLAEAIGATEIFAAADVSPFARGRDQRVARALSNRSARLRLWPGHFAVDNLDTIRTGAGGPYTVFTPFYKRWLGEPRRAVAPAPASLPELPAPPESLGAVGLSGQLLGLIRPTRSPESRWTPGEAAARAHMARYLGEPVGSYGDRHDALADQGTSGLSPYLHLGSISPRELESALPPGAGADALRRQLCWREFYAHVLLHHPQNAHAEHQPRLRRRIAWTNSEEHFNAWTEGMTGYPLVDAGMRELKRTGWMHNRARMVVGSFLVKDLGVDWRWGERWFMRTLLDGDEANNNGNWQWIASVGVDPQPVARRIFNPTLQQQRFDPDGRYVRTHVPELAPVPDAYLAEPWTMPEDLQREVGCVIGVDYPAPIVDHARARRDALERYATAAASEPEL